MSPNDPKTNFVIRALTRSDARRVAELTVQLGYDADVHQIRVRLDRLAGEAAHHVIGVEAPRGLVAFAHFFERPSIEKGFDMVIQSLVVDVTLRRSGIGRLLMDQIEHVARAKNCDKVVLSSQASRNDAHGFYKRLGYEVGTTSNVFLKRLV
jgi:ribosomal protein S18 acetylase RimI-like enzyme